MKIKATQDFLQNTKRYREGRSYEVDDDMAAYFVSCGWATSPNLDIDQAVHAMSSVTLDVHDAGVGQNAEIIDG